MGKEVLEYVIEKTNDLINADSCSSEAKEAAQAWLDAVGTAEEAEETRKYLAELEADIIPIDGLIALRNRSTELKSSERNQLKTLRPMQGRSRRPERYIVTVRPVRRRKRFWRRRTCCWLSKDGICVPPKGDKA